MDSTLGQHPDEEAGAKLTALKEAAELGIADLAAGRAKSFSNATALRNHLENIARKAARET